MKVIAVLTAEYVCTVALILLVPAIAWLVQPHGWVYQRDTRMIMRELESALVHYELEHEDRCPTSLDALFEERILARPPRDQWGRRFWFRCPSRHQDYGADVVSAGPDGRFETADDLTSWE